MATEQDESYGPHGADNNSRQPELDGQLPVFDDDNLSLEHIQSSPKDHWTHTAYSASASFVPLLTTEIIQWLNPQPTETILDLGCGDGVLTAKIAETCASVDGFDTSTNLIGSARNAYSMLPNVDWHVVDCRYLESCGLFKEGTYNKVFSNAALHWILRDPSTRKSVLRGAYKALQPGGDFVFEMGGAGNVADVHTALLAALVHQGVDIQVAREACPWYFPNEKLMGKMLEEVGFKVQKSKMEYRPTKLTTGATGGLEGWVRLMGAQFLEVLPLDQQKEDVVKEVCDVLKTVVTHEEDGSMWLGYVRLKVAARK